MFFGLYSGCKSLHGLLHTYTLDNEFSRYVYGGMGRDLGKGQVQLFEGTNSQPLHKDTNANTVLKRNILFSDFNLFG
jgi:hypothetical protein